LARKRVAWVPYSAGYEARLTGCDANTTRPELVKLPQTKDFLDLI